MDFPIDPKGVGDCSSSHSFGDKAGWVMLDGHQEFVDDVDKAIREDIEKHFREDVL